MSFSQAPEERAAELAEKSRDPETAEKELKSLAENGIPERDLSPEKVLAQKEEILARVQEKAEKYCWLTRSCAKASCLALLEEFGLGSMDVVQAMSPFPGLAMTGGICGGVSGGLIAVGLYFSDRDITNYESIDHYFAARKFLKRFEETFGSLLCPEVQKRLLGKAYDPFAGMDQLDAFNKSGAREKCPAAPGIGARIAAGVIIESMEQA